MPVIDRVSVKAFLAFGIVPDFRGTEILDPRSPVGTSQNGKTA